MKAIKKNTGKTLVVRKTSNPNSKEVSGLGYSDGAEIGIEKIVEHKASGKSMGKLADGTGYINMTYVDIIEDAVADDGIDTDNQE